MRQLLATFDGLVPAVIVLIPVAAITAAVSLVLRIRTSGRGVLGQPLVDALLMYSCLLAAYVVFSPQSHSDESVQLEPGNDLLVALQAAPGDTLPWIQLLGNFLLLLPIGALVPLRLPWFHQVSRIALGGMLVACVIETVQYVAVAGRVVSTDDVVLNTVGATFGGVLTLPLRVRPASGLLDIFPEHNPIVHAHRGPQHGCAFGEESTVWRLIAKIQAERGRVVPSEGRHRINETTVEFSKVSHHPRAVLVPPRNPAAKRAYPVARQAWSPDSEAVAS